MRTIPLAAAAALLALHLAACGGGSSSSPPAPALSERSPLPGAVEATDGSVMLKFSVPMDAASLAAGISVSRVGGGAVEGAVSSLGDLAYFNPSAPFPAAATLRVTVSADVRSADGARMGAPATWTFTTAHWRPISTSGAPTQRAGHTAVWTGNEMIVWGGLPATRAGGRYDPATDTWRATSVAGAPDARMGHTAVWTGSKMIVWGGTVNAAALNTGGIYDPASDTWTSISTANAPSARSGHTAVWTGSKMIVWGGAADLSGGVYDPSNDTWTATSVTGAPVIEQANGAVWADGEMIVWGGITPPGAGIGGAGIVSACGGAVGVGGRYDPVGDTWTPTSATGVPVARVHHALVWTGADVLAWGGCTADVGAGGIYTPVGDSWVSMAAAGQPATRNDPHAAWTGSKLVVWSGFVPAIFNGGGTLQTDGGIYDPQTDAWTGMPTAGSAAAAQVGSASVWTGAELVVWGGETAATGARFTP